MSTFDASIDEDDGIDFIKISDIFGLRECEGDNRGVILMIYDFEFHVTPIECQSFIRGIQKATEIGWMDD